MTTKNETRDFVTPNGLNVKLIKPELSTKYSPNLYRWLNAKEQKHRIWTSRVYRDVDGILWIGILNNYELIGTKLSSVLCYGSKSQSAAWQDIDAKEVPNFWDDYIKVGRCAIDTAHDLLFLNDESRWTINGDLRSCQWCGKVTQKLKKWTETVSFKKWVKVKT